MAGIAGAVLLMIGFLVHPPETVEGVKSAVWGPAHVLLFVSLLLSVPAVFGVYLRQARQVGSLGFVGFVLGFLGLMGFAGISYVEAFITPTLATAAPAVIEGMLSGQMSGPLNTVLPLTGLTFALGWVMFATATIRAGVLPRTPAILSLVGAVFFGLGPLVPQTIAKIAAVVFGIGIAWLSNSLRSGSS
jgi:hypothetical protein